MKEIQIIRDMEKLSSLSDYLDLLNIDYVYRPLLCRLVEAHSIVSRNLKIPLASKVLEIKRLRIVEGKPKTTERAVIVYDKVKGLQFEDLSRVNLTKLLKEKYHLTAAKYEEEVSLVAATEEEKEFFNLKDINQLVLLSGIIYDRSGVPYEYYETISLPEFYCFHSEHYYE